MSLQEVLLDDLESECKNKCCVVLGVRIVAVVIGVADVELLG